MIPVMAANSAYSGRLHGYPAQIMMTDKAYVSAYKALIALYFENQVTMDEHLVAVQKLKDGYLEGRTGARLPDVP